MRTPDWLAKYRRQNAEHPWLSAAFLALTIAMTQILFALGDEDPFTLGRFIRISMAGLAVWIILGPTGLWRYMLRRQIRKDDGRRT